MAHILYTDDIDFDRARENLIATDIDNGLSNTDVTDEDVISFMNKIRDIRAEDLQRE